MMMDTLRRYLMPGLVFQSVVIGGGYATGRELIEFFMPSGPVGGLVAMLVTMLVWGAVMAASFELARITRAYDYKTFFKNLLGPGWILFEIGYVLLLILVLSVLGAACGEIVSQAFGGPKLAGAVLLMACVGGVVFFGNATVEKILAALGLALYGVYVVFFFWCLFAFGDRIAAQLSAGGLNSSWLGSGLRYAGYNMAVMPAVLFCVRSMQSRREAVVSGWLCGPLAMLPGLLFFVPMMGFYPEIGSEALPSSFLLQQLGAVWFEAVFQLVVFSTLVATGAGLLHAVNERAAQVYRARGRQMPASARVGLALFLMAFSVFVAGAFGLIGLIAQGYGALTWFFIGVIVVPVLTLGVARIRAAKTQKAPAGGLQA